MRITKSTSVACATLCAASAGLVSAGDCVPTFELTIGQPGLTGYIARYAAWNDGSGEALYATGQFTQAGGLPANRVARWDGAAWSAVSADGPTDGWGNAVLPFQGDLYVGGFFGGITGVPNSRALARFDGAAWSAVGDTQWDFFADAVWALAEFDGELYVGGAFPDVNGQAVNNIARWDGDAWAPVGGGVLGGGSTIVLEMRVWDDGSGPALFVAGRFDTAGGVASQDVAKWDGAQWSSLGGGLVGSQVLGLQVWNDGSGEALYACGGEATPAGGGAGSNVHKWDGAQWTSLPDVAESGKLVYNLEPYDDGDGEQLYAIGSFEEAIRRFARWDGAAWTQVGAGLAGGNGFELFLWNDPDQPDAEALYAGGSFTSAGGAPSNRAVVWNGCAEVVPACPGDLTGDGAVTSEDLNALLADFGCTGGCAADLDGDGDTTSADLNILLANFGEVC